MQKINTQEAPLERLLSSCRNRRIRDLINNKLVLDFGCGINGWTARSISSRAKIVNGFEPNLMEVKSLNNEVRLYPDLNQLPFTNYEIVLALAVFEHIEPSLLIDTLDRLYNLTSPTAVIFATVPTP